jgi:hypothetical protein
MTKKLLTKQYFNLTFLFIVLFASASTAQPGGGSGGNPGGGNAPPVPISGIELLVGAGCLVGIKRSISFLKGFRKSS